MRTRTAHFTSCAFAAWICAACGGGVGSDADVGSGSTNDVAGRTPDASVPDGAGASADASVEDTGAASDGGVGATDGGAASPTLNMGVAYSPKGYVSATTAQDIADFYSGHASYGALIAYHTNWRDEGAPAGEIPGVAGEAHARAAEYGFTPVIGFGWEVVGKPDLTSASEPSNNTWSNAETRKNYLAMVTEYATRYAPKYLFLGNEVNGYWLRHSVQEWADWVSEYRACYDAVKAASPGTIVFTTLQLEHLKGLGRKNGWSDPPQWEVLDDLKDKTDAVGFTTYPYFEYDDPAEIPADYYSEIASRYAGPGIFSEIGWLADPAAPYLGSEERQAAFIPRFFALTTGLELRYVVYLFLHDVDVLDSIPAFRRIGLRAKNGTPRPADAAWTSEVATRQRAGYLPNR